MSWTVERARVASLTRSRTPDDPDLVAARRDLALARVEIRIRVAVEAAPPLPADLSARLVELIRGAPVVAAATQTVGAHAHSAAGRSTR